MKYTCFWHKESPFSNFYPTSYKLHGIEFSSTEQGIMYEKAKLFDPSGKEIDNILASSNPVYIKKQGRNVKILMKKLGEIMFGIWCIHIFMLSFKTLN